jgi:hypothetical protein
MVKYRFVKLFEIINDANDRLSSLNHQINEYFEFPNVEISHTKIFGQETGSYNAYVYVKAGDGFPSDKDMLSIKIDERTGNVSKIEILAIEKKVCETNILILKKHDIDQFCYECPRIVASVYKALNSYSYIICALGNADEIIYKNDKPSFDPHLPGIFNQKFVNDIRARLKRGKVEVKFHPFSYILEAKIFLPNSIAINEIRVRFSILYEDCKLRDIFLSNRPLKVEELEAVNKSYPKVIEEIKDFSLKKAFGKNCRYRYDSIDSI